MTAARAYITALLCFTIGCHGSATEIPAPTPADALTADVAVVAGDAVYEDVGVVYAQFGMFHVPTGDVGRVARLDGPCPYDAESGRFVCPVLVREGRTIARSYGFRDATGTPQSAYDAVTTASANFRSTMSGTVARAEWNATISHERDLTVSGLAGAETRHTIDGVGSSTQARSQHTDGGVRTYTMSAVATFTNVVVPFPRTRGAWPISGSITREVTATREGDGTSETRTRTATTTFNGTRFATLTVGEREYTLDLATGRAVLRR